MFLSFTTFLLFKNKRRKFDGNAYIQAYQKFQTEIEIALFSSNCLASF